MTAGEICTKAVVTASPGETVLDAARRMRDEHVGDLVVVDDLRRPIGVLTDRDIVVTVIAQSPDKLGDLLVGDIMSRQLATAQSDDSIDAVLGQMRAHRVRRLPVVSPNGRLEGILALDDLLEVMAKELGRLAGLVTQQTMPPEPGNGEHLRELFPGP